MTCFLKTLITYLGNLCRLVHIGLSIGLKNYGFPFLAYKYNFFNKFISLYYALFLDI